MDVLFFFPLFNICGCLDYRLIVSGFKRPLEAHDLWSLNPRDESTSVVPAFEEALITAKAHKSHHFANG